MTGAGTHRRGGKPLARLLGDADIPIPAIEQVLLTCHPRIGQRLGRLTFGRVKDRLESGSGVHSTNPDVPA